jgi:hypothetical protein
LWYQLNSFVRQPTSFEGWISGRIEIAAALKKQRLSIKQINQVLISRRNLLAQSALIIAEPADVSAIRKATDAILVRNVTCVEQGQGQNLIRARCPTVLVECVAPKVRSEQQRSINHRQVHFYGEPLA